jgi:UV DNA damage repair endonuclease
MKSEQGKGKIGHHSDFIEEIPCELITYLTDNPYIHVDLEVEAKMKEQAIFRLQQKYPGLAC